MKINLFVFFTSIVYISSSLQAQTPSPASSVQSADRIQAQINSTTLRPVLDGVLGDEIWQQATRINNFHQTNPVDHGMPSQQTEVFVAYSETFFYVGARMYDTDPSQISARQLIQGQSINFDDTMGVFLDSFNNSRTGFFFYFSTNPNGVRSEGLGSSE